MAVCQGGRPTLSIVLCSTILVSSSSFWMFAMEFTWPGSWYVARFLASGSKAMSPSFVARAISAGVFSVRKSSTTFERIWWAASLG